MPGIPQYDFLLAVGSHVECHDWPGGPGDADLSRDGCHQRAILGDADVKIHLITSPWKVGVLLQCYNVTILLY